MKKLLIIILAFFSSIGVFSQVRLSLLDGSQINLESYVFHNEEYYMDYSFLKDNGKMKNTYAYYNDIFSININGVDSIIYMPVEEGEFEIYDMQQVVYGRQYAQSDYNPWWAYVTGMVVGCGSMFIPMDATTRLVIPIAYTLGMAFVKPGESYIVKRYDDANNNDMLIYGYKNAGRKKIFKNTVIGTIGGVFLAGAIVGTLSIIDGD
ncbi:MAG TPA: hypothetical protein PKN32_09090 [Bacteroidales bacterium]|nr:hypothetical protein [Bacteroidales bacterium]